MLTGQEIKDSHDQLLAQEQNVGTNADGSAILVAGNTAGAENPVLASTRAEIQTLLDACVTSKDPAIPHELLMFGNQISDAAKKAKISIQKSVDDDHPKYNAAVAALKNLAAAIEKGGTVNKEDLLSLIAPVLPADGA